MDYEIIAHLRRVDSARNMARFYILSIAPTLFGATSVVREWGRIGSRGSRRIDLFEDASQAVNALTRMERSKRQRGYGSADGS
jgi:predicted DNA-binding WGR domain protein